MKQIIKRQDGFTLPEVIMVVAVMAIVSAMAFPDIVSFFKRQSFEQEKLVQAEIVKALDAYSKGRTAAFSDDPVNMITVPMAEAAIGAGGIFELNDPERCLAADGWGALLSNVSNLSAQEICSDVWGNPRVYTVAQGDLSYRDGSFRTYFVTILSKGENKDLDTTTWANVDAYGAFKPAGDDLISKFSDVKLKTELFEETLRRMDRIVEALDRYAQSRYNEALLTTEESQQAAIAYQLFYPAEDGDFNDTSNRPDILPSGPGTWYGQRVIDDVQSASGQNSLASGVLDSETRRDALQSLMRIIGLPQEFCCDALTGEPFFYYSNPIIRQNTSMPCDRRLEPPYMPPKLTIEPIDCNDGN